MIDEFFLCDRNGRCQSVKCLRLNTDTHFTLVGRVCPHFLNEYATMKIKMANLQVFGRKAQLKSKGFAEHDACFLERLPINGVPQLESY